MEDAGHHEVIALPPARQVAGHEQIFGLFWGVAEAETATDPIFIKDHVVGCVITVIGNTVGPRSGVRIQHRYAQLSVTFNGEKMCQCGTLQSGRERRSGESGNPLEFTLFDGELILPAFAGEPQHARIQRDLTAGEITESPWVPLSHEGYGHGHVLDLIAVIEGSATFS